MRVSREAGLFSSAAFPLSQLTQDRSLYLGCCLYRSRRSDDKYIIRAGREFIQYTCRSMAEYSARSVALYRSAQFF